MKGWVKLLAWLDNHGWLIRKPWGSAWVWKQDNPYPTGEAEDMSFEYTPVALYVADVLQGERGSNGR